ERRRLEWWGMEWWGMEWRQLLARQLERRESLAWRRLVRWRLAWRMVRRRMVRAVVRLGLFGLVLLLERELLLRIPARLSLLRLPLLRLSLSLCLPSLPSLPGLCAGLAAGDRGAAADGSGAAAVLVLMRLSQGLPSLCPVLRGRVAGRAADPAAHAVGVRNSREAYA